MSILKDIRFLVLISLILTAFGFIGFQYLDPLRSGVIVDFVYPENKCTDVEVGDVVNQVGGKIITSSEIFNDFTKNLQPDEFVSIVINNEVGNCRALNRSNLGFVVKDFESEVIKFGIDIEGGTRFVLQPKEDVSRDKANEIVATLDSRIDFYGLRDVRVTLLSDPVTNKELIQIEMVGATIEDINDFLASQGKFVGKISQDIDFENDIGEVSLGDNFYEIELRDSDIFVNGSLYSTDDIFYLEDIEFEIGNITNSSVNLFGTTFTNDDIVAVLTDPQHSSIGPIGDGYQFSFSIQVSRAGAERFAKLTKNQPIIFRGTDSILESTFVFFLDDKVVNELTISGNLAGQAVQTPSISGFDLTREDALNEKIRLESILRSGSLPVELEVIKISTITQTAGSDLIKSTFLVAIGAVIAISAVIYIRYRDFRIVLPMIVLSFSEILFILGMASSQIFGVIIIISALLIGVVKKEINGIVGWITVIAMVMTAYTIVSVKWTLDIPAIAGLIAVLGTGVSQMIIVTDQIIKGREERSWAENHKFAMSIIWNSAATVTFAMIPLILLGIGSLKGFAITTIIGIFIGVLITRPAYMAVLERIKKSEITGDVS